MTAGTRNVVLVAVGYYYLVAAVLAAGVEEAQVSRRCRGAGWNEDGRLHRALRGGRERMRLECQGGGHSLPCRPAAERRTGLARPRGLGQGGVVMVEWWSGLALLLAVR